MKTIALVLLITLALSGCSWVSPSTFPEKPNADLTVYRCGELAPLADTIIAIVEVLGGAALMGVYVTDEDNDSGELFAGDPLPLTGGIAFLVAGTLHGLSAYYGWSKSAECHEQLNRDRDLQLDPVPPAAGAVPKE